MRTGWLAVAALRAADAQVYDFERACPDAKSLDGLYLFYVFSEAESPAAGPGPPTAEFQSLAATEGGRPLPGDLAGEFQASLFLHRDFDRLIDPRHFCSSAQDVAEGLSPRQNELLLRTRLLPLPSSSSPSSSSPSSSSALAAGARVFSTSFGGSAAARFDLHETGAYVLVISNCGTSRNVIVSGRVVVRNVYGYLPANEYHKLPFYSFLSCVYAVVLGVWATMMYWWRGELFPIHYSILGVTILSLGEAGLYSMMLHSWNTSGSRSGLILAVALLVSVMKSAGSYMLVLVASLGWGVTTSELDEKTTVKVEAILTCYVVLEFVRELMISFRFTHQVSMNFTLLCLLPVALLNLGIFSWIFFALSNLIKKLKQTRQKEKLYIFQRLWAVLVTVAIIAAFSTVFEFLVLPLGFSQRWHYQWLFGDGVSHVLFLMVLLVIVCLWSPNENSKRYVFSQQLGTSGRFPQPESVFEGEKKGDSSDVNDVAVTAGLERVDPQTIGAPSDA